MLCQIFFNLLQPRYFLVMIGYNGTFSGCVTVLFSLYPNVAFSCWPYGEIICLVQVDRLNLMILLIPFQHKLWLSFYLDIINSTSSLILISGHFPIFPQSTLLCHRYFDGNWSLLQHRQHRNVHSSVHQEGNLFWDILSI